LEDPYKETNASDRINITSTKKECYLQYTVTTV